MRLDRASITGKAFSASAAGYSREEVDRHLAAVADALEEASPDPVSSDAGEQLREIVAGAERSTAALLRKAEEEAAALRVAAQHDADAIREKARQEAASQLSDVMAAVESLRQRATALERGVEDSAVRVRDTGEALAQRLASDAAPLVAVLHERAAAIGAELDLIGTGLAAPPPEPAQAVPASAGPPPADATPAAETRSKQGAEASAEPGTGLVDSDLDRAAEELDAAVGGSDHAAPDRGDSPREHGGASAPASSDSDSASSDSERSGSEGARLLALNMALNGAPRAEAEERLRDGFAVDDLAEILDEVYKRAESVE